MTSRIAKMIESLYLEIIEVNLSAVYLSATNYRNKIEV